LKNLGITDDKIEKAVAPFFKNIKESFDRLPEGKSLQDILTEGPKLPEGTRQAAYSWIMNSAQFKRISKVLKDVRKCAIEMENADKPIASYRDLVNRFLEETGKRIEFNARGILNVIIHKDIVASVEAFSSGERQIVVLLSHILFHPAAQKANVLIIDEPELSLHVSWQQIFTDSIRKANSDIQMIFATHSPAIIVENVDKCIDLSEVVK